MLNGEASWEKTERTMMKEAVECALGKANLTCENMDYMLAGDLLNQCISANFAARDLGIPLLGLYGACSTMAESAGLAAMLIDGGYALHAVAAVSSHYGTSERQYRFPTEYGGQRPPYSQYTVTGAGALVLGHGQHFQGQLARITHFTSGKVTDLGRRDPFDMGSAMAPAAADTILRHFSDLSLAPDHYDLVLTGDLALVGHSLTEELLRQQGLVLKERMQDCGLLVFDRTRQPVFSGGSGCGCSAVVLCGHIMDMFKQAKLKRLLLVGTGALLSPTTFQQGDSIPCIAHAVAFELSDDRFLE
jgi:stage V sporulation protein AD